MWRFLLHNSESIEGVEAISCGTFKRKDMTKREDTGYLCRQLLHCSTKAEDFSRCDHSVFDEYHWMKRWNDIVLDMKRRGFAIFKGWMRRATNVVSNNEYLTTELTESLKASQQ
jgi:hypothetical protein